MRDDGIHDHGCPGGTRVEQGKVRLERKIPRRDRIRGWDTSLMRRMAMQCASPVFGTLQRSSGFVGNHALLVYNHGSLAMSIFVRPWTTTVYYGHAVHPHVYLLFVCCVSLSLCCSSVICPNKCPSIVPPWRALFYMLRSVWA